MTGIFLRKEIRTYTWERLWETQEVMAVYKPDRSFRIKPTLLTFWSWITYYPPNWKEISLFCLSHPSLWYWVIAAAAKSLQSCPTLCNRWDSSPPGFPIPGILQARTLEWVAISFSNTWKWKVKVKSLSHVWLLATPWTAAYRLLHPWDFPGKSTGVGCHCLLHS